MENKKYIKKWLTDKLTGEERKIFEETEDYQVLSRIWDGLIIAKPPTVDSEKELERFREANDLQPRVIEVSWHKQLIRIAASILLVFVTGYFLYLVSTNDQVIKLSSAYNELYLPDSSMVILNKGSELTYKPDDWLSHRKVELKGESFFKVRSGFKFEVKTADGLVSVLGTEFNVKQRTDFFEVICHEGKVRVIAASDSTDLIAGKGFQLIGETAMRFDASVEEKPNWLQGKSSFYKTPFYTVINELETQYDIVIETQGISLETTFTGNFPNDNLKLALDAITAPSGYIYQINKDKVQLTGEGN